MNVNRFKDHFRQCDHDSVAAADPTILEMVADHDLVLVLDKNNELIVFCAIKAVQKLLSDGVLENVYTCSDIYTYHQAIPKPDPTCHPLREDFLRQNPRSDCRAAEDRELAKCGVEHYGCREMTGHPHSSILYMTRGSSASRYYRFENLATRVYPKLKRGAWRVLTEASAFFFKRLMPVLHNDYIDVCQGVDEDIRMDTMAKGEPFTLRALLVNLSSEDHVDIKECRYGIAALVPFGNFEGRS